MSPLSRLTSHCPSYLRRVAISTIPVLTLILTLVPPALAHDPTVDSYNWTCSGGRPPSEGASDGNCFQHHTYADETWKWGTAPTAWRDAIRAGQSQWDKTDGHQFDFIERSDGRSVVNATTSVIAATQMP